MIVRDKNGRLYERFNSGDYPGKENNNKLVWFMITLFLAILMVIGVCIAYLVLGTIID
jgi:hypothetical protein